MTIEGNKDEADRCIEIAQNAFSSGNIEKAEKFLIKAEKLYPSPRAKELLTLIQSGSPPSSSKKTPPSTPSTEDVRRRKAPTHSTSHREYSSEQLEAVRRVNTKCKDYYEILGMYCSCFTIIWCRSAICFSRKPVSLFLFLI